MSCSGLTEHVIEQLEAHYARGSTRLRRVRYLMAALNMGMDEARKVAELSEKARWPEVRLEVVDAVRRLRQ